MKTVIGVRFRQSNKVYYFDPFEQDVKKGQGVIVETAKGIEFGEVTMEPTELPDEEIVAPLRPILRIANDNDRKNLAANMAKEKEAEKIAAQKIADRGLEMKLVGVEYAFNGSKITFYFTADGRVDFRELVKDLASVFKTRIELRQIGVRDEAKLLGGIGSCGRVVCCHSYLGDFHPVSIKMAKEQNLSLSPTKISGLCGRLMCCLKYEQECYEDARRRMPRVGKDVITPDGRGTVVENNLLRERVKVKIMLPDGTFDLRDYPLGEIKRIETARGEIPSKVKEPEAVPPVDEDGEDDEADDVYEGIKVLTEAADAAAPDPEEDETLPPAE